RLEAEELREVASRRQGQGSSGRLPVDQAEVLEALRVLVDLGADYVEQVALEERLVVGDQGGGLEEVPIDLRRREGPRPFRELGSDLHRPLRADLRDLDRALPLRVLLGEGSKMRPDHVG